MSLCLIGGGSKEPFIREALVHSTGAETLIIPTACSTENAYNRKVAATSKFFAALGITATVLHGFDQAPTQTEIDQKFGENNFWYVVGGNSPHFMRTIDQYGVREPLIAGAAEGKSIAGVSLGALWPFEVGHINPAKNSEKEEWDFELLPMLGVLKASAAAHANIIDPTKTLTRLEDFTNRFPQTHLRYGFGIDENSALLITPDSSRVLTSRPESAVHLLEQQNGLVEVTRLGSNQDISDIITSIQ